MTLQIDITPERVLTVSGEQKSDPCTGWDERFQERQFGQFERLFALADDADTSSCTLYNQCKLETWCFDHYCQETEYGQGPESRSRN